MDPATLDGPCDGHLVKRTGDAQQLIPLATDQVSGIGVRPGRAAAGERARGMYQRRGCALYVGNAHPENESHGSTSLGELVANSVPLSTDERRRIVEQAMLLIDQLYVHLPLKRAMHAVDPLQRLRLLNRRLDGLDERAFHDEMIGIFVGLRDLHTNYILPTPYRGANAVLPFRVEEYWEDGERRYLVSGADPAATAPPFVPGVEVTHWNGILMRRAVDLNGQRNGGSNLEARQAFR